MRVLMLGWEFPPHISGGLGTACHGLTRGLARRGTEVLFVVPRAFGDERAGHLRLLGADAVPLAPDSAGVGGIALLAVDSALAPYLDEVSYLARRRRLGDAPPSPRPPGGRRARLAGPPPSAAFDPSGGRTVVAPRDGGGASYGPDLMAEVGRYARATAAIARGRDFDFRFDLVHAHDWMTYPAGLAAARAEGKPLVAHVHASEHDRCPRGPNPAIVEIEREGLRAADRVVCVSRYTAGVVRRRYGVEASRIRVVHNGVAPLRRRPPRRGARPGRGPAALFLGRVTSQKGPDRDLDAAALVARRLPAATFVVAGSGDLLPSMIERAARLGLSRRVRFTGFLGPADVARAYAMADVYVMPSRSEPFGIAPLEALLHGVPVIVSRRSGVAEVLPSAPTVDPDDPRDVAGRILEVLGDRALPRRAARRGGRGAARLRWDRAADRLLDVYREVAAGEPSRA